MLDYDKDNFRVGLLRGIANPSATTGTGFVVSGPPNTNARVTGDFGSSQPGSNVFSIYTGYAALTTVKATTGVSAPINFRARTVPNASLIGTTSAFSGAFPGGSAPASAAMEAGALYRGTLTLTRTAIGITLSYTVERVGDGVVMMSYSATDSGSTFTSFDTVAFYIARKSVNFDFYLSNVVVERSVQ